jgi:hypothetical protein
LIRRAAVKTRMGATAIIKVEISADRVARLADGFVGSQIYLLVFDAAPQPFDEHIIPPGPRLEHSSQMGSQSGLQGTRPAAAAVVSRPQQSSLYWALKCILQITRPAILVPIALAQLLEPPCTDPYARWCGRGGAARLAPIPIVGTNAKCWTAPTASDDGRELEATADCQDDAFDPNAVILLDELSRLSSTAIHRSPAEMLSDHAFKTKPDHGCS